MIIGIDASRAHAEQKTGTEWYSYSVIQELKKCIPPSVHVRLYSKEPLRGDLAELPSNWESRVLRWTPGFLWTQLRLSIEMLLHPVDALYVSAHTLPLIGGRKNIAVIHDVGFFRHTELYNTADVARATSSWKKRMIALVVRIATLGRYGASERDYHRFAFRLAVRKSDAIITISQFSFHEICAVADDADVQERMHVVYNGIVRRDVPSNADRIIADAGIARPYIVTLGRVEEKKNMLNAVQSFIAAQRRTGWDGDLVCIGSFGYGSERILEAVQKSGSAERIHFLGWRDENTVAAFLSRAHTFYFPTLYEGFGMPVAEALDMGVPVVCSAIPPLQEIAADCVRYCDPRSVESMTDALTAVMTDRNHAVDIQKGKDRAAQFQWATTAQRTWAIIQALL